MGLRGAKPGWIEWEKPTKLALLRWWAMEGADDVAIAAKIGIAVSTFYEWKKKSKKISEAVARGKEETDAPIISVLYQLALKGEPWAVTMWLRNRQPERFRDKQEISMKHETVVIHDSIPDSIPDHD